METLSPDQIPPVVGDPLDPPGEYALLRDIVVGKEREGLEDLRTRFDGFERDLMDKVGEQLVTAIEARCEKSPEAQAEFGEALRGPVEEAIRSSVVRDRSRLSSSLFPIMGPATRDYVTNLFKGMVEDLNEVIRNTTSLRRMRWRVEAKLTGKSFSEYILLKTLNYRVEEVFLMQADTGMLLQHAAREEAGGERDAELVSGMFSAIRSFVQDSFGAAGTSRDGDESKEELGRFSFGNKEVIIEAGPSAIIAASVDGTPPPNFRETLRGIIELLHGEHASALDTFSGDPEEMEFTRPILETAMIENRAEKENRGGFWRAWLVLGLVLAGLVVFGVSKWNEGKKVDAFVDALRTAPGIEGVQLERRDGADVITGLRDPLAQDPASLAKQAGFEAERFEFEFAPYHSIGTTFDKHRQSVAEAALLRERASASAEVLRHSRMLAFAEIRSRYSAFDGLSFELTSDGRLRLEGALPEPLFSTVKRDLAPYSDVFSGLDTSLLENATEHEIDRLLEELSSVRIRFVSGELTLVEGAAADIEHVARLGSELGEQAALIGARSELQLRAVPLHGRYEDFLEEVADMRLKFLKGELVAAGLPVSCFSNPAVDVDQQDDAEFGIVYIVPTLTRLPQTP